MARSNFNDPNVKVEKKATAPTKYKYTHKIKTCSPSAKILIQTARAVHAFEGPACRNVVAFLAGYYGKDQAGFKKQMTTLKKDDYVDLSNRSTVTLTSKGKDFVSPHLDAVHRVNNEEIHNCIRALPFLTKPKPRKLFDLLANGKTLSKAHVAKELDYPNANTAGFKKLMSGQKKEGFMEFVGKNSVRLSDDAFPFGRP